MSNAVNKVIRALKHPDIVIRVLDRVGYNFLCKFGHLKFKRFIVLARSRTGSNLLISFLNSNPSIRAESEILGRLNGRNYKDILENVFSKQPRRIKAKGFKIFYYHPMDDESNNAWDDLVNMDNLWVIHLKRRNILRTLISRKIAGSQDVWQISPSDMSKSGGSKSVTFTAEELEEGFRQTRDWEERWDQMFQNHPITCIYYEDLVRDPEGTYRKITDFLGVNYVKPITNIRKQNPERLSDLVTNYDELKNTFSGTEWQHLFEE
jgi:LPS sulfotransferase NodH